MAYCIRVKQLTLAACIGLATPAWANLQAVPVVTGLDHPWDMVFLPEGEMLVTERSGQLRRIVNGQLQRSPVSGLPRTAVQGQGGLMGLALHPNFADNRWLYFTYLDPSGSGTNTTLGRGRYENGQLSKVEVIFQAEPRLRGGRHFGGRIVFDRQGYVYLGLGDRGQEQLSQDNRNHVGTVVRLHDDGRVPSDNPFVNVANVRPEIYSYGHRNIQGMTLHPETGVVWTHEHGPQGGDEINGLKPAANYGWPVITYGEQYGGGPVGEGRTSAPSMEQPLHYWTPSIAPSGMVFYQGDKYPSWDGNLLVGSLKFGLLSRMTENNGQWTEEYLLRNAIGRIRDVRQGPDGYVYVLNDQRNGGVYRLEWQP